MMDKNKIIASIKEMIKERDDFFVIEQVIGNNGDLNFSSIEALELLFMLEDKFNITISDNELNLEILKNMDSLSKFIENKMSK